eukprot:TRINITY_DN35305_c0_g1_i1.p1 TRINITY_DN35305_c0_g1~~TRINITY_DN35305_c0_g1_i1.p1  ORF type:complete len:159 (-),score=22.21 TRINITY_DN35305_c0_g1_i1:74-550(-)
MMGDDYADEVEQIDDDRPRVLSLQSEEDFNALLERENTPSGPLIVIVAMSSVCSASKQEVATYLPQLAVDPEFHSVLFASFDPLAPSAHALAKRLTLSATPCFLFFHAERELYRFDGSNHVKARAASSRMLAARNAAAAAFAADGPGMAIPEEDADDV